MKSGSNTFSIRWGLLRGESAVASIGVAVALILAVAVSACGAWLVRTQRQAAETARLQHLETVADLLATTAEPAIVHDLHAVRLQVMDASARYGLSRCRVVTEAGDTLADNLAARIDATIDSATFAQAAAEAQTQVSGGVVIVTRSVLVPGKGWAGLELTAPFNPEGVVNWEAEAGVGTIGAMSLLALLVVYRYQRSKLLAVGAVREALLEMHRGETSEAALQVAGNLGIEAEQWNSMLIEQQRLRRAAAAQQAKQALGTLASDGDELSSGCDAMPQGLVMVDDSLRVKYANHAAALFLHRPRETMVGNPIDDMLGVEELRVSLREAVSSGRRATHLIDRRGETNGGVLRFIIRPVRRADSSSAMIVVEDVTQQRAAEDARHEFVAHATHELRAPLTNIRLYLESLLDDNQLDPTQRARSLNIINAETHRLERMVGDMLSVAEIEAGSLKLKHDDVNLMQVLADVASDFDQQAKEKRVDLEATLPPKLPTLQGDRDKLTMAIQNIVGNAVKYTPANGTVTVSAEVAKGAVVIEVHDTGIGIKPEEHEKVFEKFYRATDKRVSGITGSGLGLALAREVVRLHGGDITVDSQIDQGSTFTIRLPIADAK